MFVKNGDGKILNIVNSENLNIDNKKVRKAMNKQKKIVKIKSEDISK